MAKQYEIRCIEVTGAVTEICEAMIGSDNDSESYTLAELMDGVVIKDNVDGTTAWKLVVNKSGVLSTVSQTAT